jgi:cytochrome P450
MALPPGPNAPMMIQTASFLRRPFRFLDQCARTYGEPFSVHLGFTGKKRGVIVSSAKLIREVLTAPPGLLSGAKGNEALRPILGDDSVGLVDGESHARARRLMSPSLHGERMRAYSDAMRDVTSRHLARWPSGPFALLPKLHDITLEILLRTVFGYEGEELEEVRKQVESLIDVLDNPLVLMLPALQRDLGPLTPWRRFVRERAAMDALVYKVIARARGNGKGDHEDILSLLVQARDDGESMTDKELRDELVTLLLAGHATTATSIAWFFERVLAHEPTWDLLGQEIADVVGGGPLDSTHLPKLELLDATLKEAMRMRPASPGLFRMATEPYTLGDHELPAGTFIMASSYLTHMQADQYPEPERFDPKRFLGTKPDAYSWIPFGGGSRRCIGMAFALYEMKVVCATVLAKARMQLAEPGPVGVTCRAVFQSPMKGLRVTAGPAEDVLPKRAAAVSPSSSRTETRAS